MRLIDANLAQQIADKELNANDAGIVQYILSHTPTIEAYIEQDIYDTYTDGYLKGIE